MEDEGDGEKERRGIHRIYQKYFREYRYHGEKVRTRVCDINFIEKE